MSVTASRLPELDADAARPFRHIPALDGVRAVAITFVTLLHFSSPWRRGEEGLFAGGYIGVDVFFVLSGFLITSLLVGERATRGGVSFRAFYARRGLRLFPALAILLVAHAIFIQTTTGDMATELKLILAVVFYVSNLAQAAGFEELTRSSLAFTWSLSIEEQFYLFWPALLLFGLLRVARSRRVLLGLVLGVALLSALMRSYTWLVEGDYLAAYLRTDGRVDGLLVGAAAAFAWRWRAVPRRHLGAAATVSFAFLVLLACFGPKPNGFMFTVGFAAVSIASAVIILAIAEGVWTLAPAFASGPMRAVGRVSYGIYLWQGLSLRIALRAIGPDHGAFPLAATGFVIMVVAVVASWFLVEAPALRLKERFSR